MRKLSILFLLLVCSLSVFANEQITRPDWVEDSVYPFESHYYSWNGYNMHYIDEAPEGEAKGTVVAVHGNATYSIIYRKMITQLKSMGFRVIAFDQFGYGLSEFPHPKDFDYKPSSHTKVLIDFIKDKNLENIYFVLQDWGGPIGIAATQSMPERVSGLLLMNTWAWPLDETPDGEFNYYHIVRDRGYDAINNPKFYIDGSLVKGGARGLAKRNAEKGTDKYNALQNMQMAPYVNLKNPCELLYLGVTLPVWISARSTVEDTPFLKEIEENMGSITHLPVYLMFGDDTAFGPLKLYRGENGPQCPEGCSPDSTEINWKTNCIDADGNLIWPYLDKFKSLWQTENIVGIWTDPSHGHWLQDEVPEIACQKVLDIWERNNQ